VAGGKMNKTECKRRYPLGTVFIVDTERGYIPFKVDDYVYFLGNYGHNVYPATYIKNSLILMNLENMHILERFSSVSEYKQSEWAQEID